MPIEKRKELLLKTENTLSYSKRCELLNINRTSSYYQAKNSESDLNLELMKLMDERYLDHPECGSNKMFIWLTMDKNYEVNQKRIDRLFYKIMGLRSLQPGPHTSNGNRQHKKYPYLLKHLKINKCDQVWMTDITYVRMEHGYMYMMAFIDVYSRAILHWSISNTMDSLWCCKVLEECIELHGCPQIINTDQGSQFTSDDFVYRVLNNGIKLSMDGKGRATDNIYIERFWRTIKYEHIFIRPASSIKGLYAGIEWYINWYNNERRHDSIDEQFPMDVYNKEVQSKDAA